VIQRALAQIICLAKALEFDLRQAVVGYWFTFLWGSQRLLWDRGAGWLFFAGQRPSISTAAASMAGLHLGLLSDLQRVVNFDPQLPDGALEPMSRGT